MRTHLLMTSVLALGAVPITAIPVAYANANAGSRFFVAVEPAPADLDQAGFEALTWVPVGSVGSVGETGTSTNILTYDTWDTDVIQKAKGISDAGSPELECARIQADAGQILLRQAARTNFNYAFKIERTDQVTPAGTPTIIYNRGLVTGPMRSNGRNEDFQLEKYNLALQQREVVVDPT